MVEPFEIGLKSQEQDAFLLLTNVWGHVGQTRKLKATWAAPVTGLTAGTRKAVLPV